MAATIYERDNCIGDILLGAGGGNPAKDRHAVKGRVPILLGLLHAKETGISSSCLEYAPPFYVHYASLNLSNVV